MIKMEVFVMAIMVAFVISYGLLKLDQFINRRKFYQEMEENSKEWEKW